MGTNSAGSVGAGNEGQTDMGRGSDTSFSYTKEQRKTGKADVGAVKPNPNTVDGNKRTVTDPRLA